MRQLRIGREIRGVGRVSRPMRRHPSLLATLFAFSFKEEHVVVSAESKRMRKTSKGDDVDERQKPKKGQVSKSDLTAEKKKEI